MTKRMRSKTDSGFKPLEYFIGIVTPAAAAAPKKSISAADAQKYA